MGSVGGGASGEEGVGGALQEMRAAMCARAEALVGFCRPCRDSQPIKRAYPALKCWAKIFRPTMWDWSVVDSSSIAMRGDNPHPAKRRRDGPPAGCPATRVGWR